MDFITSLDYSQTIVGNNYKMGKSEINHEINTLHSVHKAF